MESKLNRFYIYAFLGLIMEVFWTGVSAMVSGDINVVGHTSIWMIAIYGLAVFLEPVHDRIRGYSPIVRGLVWLFFVWTIEYITGSVLNNVFGVQPWRYIDGLNVNGYITVLYAVPWMIVGLAFERIHDFLDGMQGRLERNRS